CLVSSGLSGNEIVLRWHLLRTVDFQQGIAALYLIADLGNQTGNPARERRQNGRASIFIERYLTDRRSLNAECIRLDFHHVELVHLIGADADIIGTLR